MLALLARVLGILLGIAGLCYFTNGFLSFLAPWLDLRLNPYTSLACLPGEALTSLWMATMGLNVAKWKAWTTEPESEISV